MIYLRTPHELLNTVVHVEIEIVDAADAPSPIGVFPVGKRRKALRWFNSVVKLSKELVQAISFCEVHPTLLYSSNDSQVAHIKASI